MQTIYVIMEMKKKTGGPLPFIGLSSLPSLYISPYIRQALSLVYKGYYKGYADCAHHRHGGGYFFGAATTILSKPHQRITYRDPYYLLIHQLNPPLTDQELTT